MSASPLKADIDRWKRKFRFVPQAEGDTPIGKRNGSPTTLQHDEFRPPFAVIEW
jgi:hypothetical protein